MAPIHGFQAQIKTASGHLGKVSRSAKQSNLVLVSSGSVDFINLSLGGLNADSKTREAV